MSFSVQAELKMGSNEHLGVEDANAPDITDDTDVEDAGQDHHVDDSEDQGDQTDLVETGKDESGGRKMAKAPSAEEQFLESNQQGYFSILLCFSPSFLIFLPDSLSFSRPLSLLSETLIFYPNL